jgi:hypothetical protein
MGRRIMTVSISRTARAGVVALGFILGTAGTARGETVPPEVPDADAIAPDPDALMAGVPDAALLPELPPAPVPSPTLLPEPPPLPPAGGELLAGLLNSLTGLLTGLLSSVTNLLGGLLGGLSS